MPGTLMTRGASASRGQASGESELWKTGIISRVHHWYQRTCAARAAAYRGRAASSEGAAARAWCSVQASARASEVPVPSCGLIAWAASPTRTAARRGGEPVRRADDHVAVGRGQQVVDPVEQGRELVGQGSGAVPPGVEPGACDGGEGVAAVRTRRSRPAQAGGEYAEVVAGAAQALEQAVGGQPVGVVDDRPERAVLVGVVADRHVHAAPDPRPAAVAADDQVVGRRGRPWRSRRPARRRPAGRR